MKNYYDTLELTGDAGLEDIKKAYFKLIRKYPPDKEPDKFKEIREAYEILLTEDYRKEFKVIQRIPSPFKEIYRCAKNYEKKEQIQSAINVCREGLQIDPKQPELNLYLAKLYLSNDEPGKAIKLLEKRISNSDDSGKLDTLLAIAYDRRGWNKKAAVQFEKAYQAGERDEAFLIMYAHNLYQQKKYETAKTLLFAMLNQSASGFLEKDALNIGILISLSLIYLQLNSQDNGEFYQRLEDFINRNQGKKNLCKNLLFDMLDALMNEFDMNKHDTGILRHISSLLQPYTELSHEQSQFLIHTGFIIEKTEILRDHRIGETLKEAMDVFFYMEIMKNSKLDFLPGDLELDLLDSQLNIIDEYNQLKEELEIINCEYPLLKGAMKDFLDELERNDNKAFLWSKYEKKYCKKAGYPSRGHLVRNREDEDEFQEESDLFWEQEPYRRESPKIGRNDPCPCGSGKKYKKCCGK